MAAPAAMLAQGLFMVLLPVALWLWATGRPRPGRAGWALIAWGGLFFVLSQVVNTPLRAIAFALVPAGPTPATPGLAQIVAFSLIAGLGEEGARYVAMSRVGALRRRLDRATAATYGLGHGGLESLLLGLALLGTAYLFRLADDPAQAGALPIELLAQAQAAAALSWYVYLAGALERAFAIGLHVGLSLVVMRAVRDRRPSLLLAAIGWHAPGGRRAAGRRFRAPARRAGT